MLHFVHLLREIKNKLKIISMIFFFTCMFENLRSLESQFQAWKFSPLLYKCQSDARVS